MGIIEVKNLSKLYEDGKNSSVIFKDINLDSENGEKVLKLLVNGIRKYHQTLVMVTHDMDIANQADCVIKIPMK